MLSNYLGLSKLEAVDQELRTRDLVLKDLHDRLLQAQQSMKAAYDTKHRLVQYNVGDLVLLRLHPYCQPSLAPQRYTKLSSHSYGPFHILAKFGSVAYKLDLPSDSKIHLIFHVSCLKLFHGSSVPIEPSLPTLSKGELHPQPEAVLDYSTFQNQPQALIHWEGLSPANASLENVSYLQTCFPSFTLADKLDLHRGGDVMDRTWSRPFKGQVYKRRAEQVGM